MKIQSFIEKAIEGGWKQQQAAQFVIGSDWRAQIMDHILLDPEAWKAVGKVEGWFRKEKYCPTCKILKPHKACRGCKGYRYELLPVEALWKKNMHRMIDALAEGRSIEQFLETL